VQDREDAFSGSNARQDAQGERDWPSQHQHQRRGDADDQVLDHVCRELGAGQGDRRRDRQSDRTDEEQILPGGGATYRLDDAAARRR
jgi:hypothetical protein